MKVRFKGHETFYFREGWLTKALLYLNNNQGTLFNEENSVRTLGVGSNMVKSIKYWMIACGLYKTPARNSGKNGLTKLGELIACRDPYLEDSFTLWILHINLISNFSQATTWALFFNNFDIDVFNIEEVQQYLKQQVELLECAFNEKSLNNDISLLLNMYDSYQDNDDPEDNLICPLSHLGLITKVKNIYARNSVSQREIPELLALYLITKYAIENELDNIPIQSLLEGSLSFKSVFYCSRITLSEILERLESMNYIKTVKASGLESIVLQTKDYNDFSVIEQYYNEENL